MTTSLVLIRAFEFVGRGHNALSRLLEQNYAFLLAPFASESIAEFLAILFQVSHLSQLYVQICTHTRHFLILQKFWKLNVFLKIYIVYFDKYISFQEKNCFLVQNYI